MIYKLKNKTPDISKTCFIAESADIIGEVSLGEDSGIWFNTTLRGDIAPVKVGKRSNIQDGSILHVNYNMPCIVGDNVTVGHGVILHGATVEDGCLIGMGAIILNQAVIGKESIVGAGALVTEGKIFPPRSMILGSPAKKVRELTEEEVEKIKENVADYVKKGKENSVYLEKLN